MLRVCSSPAILSRSASSMTNSAVGSGTTLSNLTGQYTGRLMKGALKGHVDGNKVEFSSSGRFEGTSLHYTYKGTFEGQQMSGIVDLGEYGTATFTASCKA